MNIFQKDNAYQEIKSRYAKVIRIITMNVTRKIHFKFHIITFSHLLMIIPLQFLSYELSISRNLNLTCLEICKSCNS